MRPSFEPTQYHSHFSSIKNPYRFLSQSSSMESNSTSDNDSFNYKIARNLVEKAHLQANVLTKRNTSIIMPYGFELLIGYPQPSTQACWPKWPLRHYPAIGYPRDMNHEEAESFGFVF